MGCWVAFQNFTETDTHTETGGERLVIYFIQDESTHHIKIGYTGGDDAEARLKALQTGNPSGLTLLKTMPGDAKAEAALHERFAKSRVRGTWFHPSPEVMQLLIAPPVAQLPAVVEQARPWPLKIYLAGKISRGDWREDIVDLGMVAERTEDGPIGADYWEMMPGSIDGTHHYVGPFFKDMRHGCQGEHGNDLAESDCECHGDTDQHVHAQHECSYYSESLPSLRERLYGECFRSVQSCDVLFAFIDREDCYGTLVEIGWARSLGKQVWICAAARFQELWLAVESADSLANHRNPAECLQSMLDHYRQQGVLPPRFVVNRRMPGIVTTVMSNVVERKKA